MSPLMPLKMSRYKVLISAPPACWLGAVLATRRFIALFPVLHQFVDLAGGIACAESIVDIDHCDTTAATIEHSQQRSQTAEACAVSNAGWHGDHRLCDKASDDARKSAFHTGDDNHNICGLNRLEPAKQTMHASDSDIGNALDVIAHDFRGYRGFFGNGQIARASTGNDDCAGALFCVSLLNCDASSEFVVGDSLKLLFQNARMFRSDTRYENALFALDEFRGYFQDLFGCFTRAEDHFGKSFAKGAMGVDLGKAEVDDGSGLEGLEDLVAADTAGSEFLEQLDCFSRRHAGKMRQKSKNPSAKS
jgi:hypothetical protein